MASIDRYRPPAREGYQPPSSAIVRPSSPSSSSSKHRRNSSNVPPAVPSPPINSSSRSSPPRPTATTATTATSSSSRGRINSILSPASSVRDTPVDMPNQWLFTQDEVLSSPSIIDGLLPTEERLRRAKGVNFIFQAGMLLELPQITLHVAGVFFHRFYMRCSMVEEKHGIHHYNIAATALFLANKTEENCRKTKDIIVAVAKVAQKNPKLIIDEQSKEYWRWRDSILMYEEIMLENLTFDLMISAPHNALYACLGTIGAIHNKHLRQSAWAFCNDSGLTTLPLLMEARDIAIASIYFSSNFTKQPIEDINGKPWWEVVDGKTGLIVQATHVLYEFYKENPLRKQENPYQGSPEFNLDNTRKTDGSSTNATPRTDRDTASPKPRVNGTTQGAPDRAESTNPEEVSQTVPGDSDAPLKEAANDLNTHSGTNGNIESLDGSGLVSPGSKRKGIEDMSLELRENKRPRSTAEDGDEGEIPE